MSDTRFPGVAVYPHVRNDADTPAYLAMWLVFC